MAHTGESEAPLRPRDSDMEGPKSLAHGQRAALFSNHSLAFLDDNRNASNNQQALDSSDQLDEQAKEEAGLQSMSQEAEQSVSARAEEIVLIVEEAIKDASAAAKIKKTHSSRSGARFSSMVVETGSTYYPPEQCEKSVNQPFEEHLKVRSDSEEAHQGCAWCEREKLLEKADEILSKIEKDGDESGQGLQDEGASAQSSEQEAKDDDGVGMDGTGVTKRKRQNEDDETGQAAKRSKAPTSAWGWLWNKLY